MQALVIPGPTADGEVTQGNMHELRMIRDKRLQGAGVTVQVVQRSAEIDHIESEHHIRAWQEFGIGACTIERMRIRHVEARAVIEDRDCQQFRELDEGSRGVGMPSDGIFASAPKITLKIAMVMSGLSMAHPAPSAVCL